MIEAADEIANDVEASIQNGCDEAQHLKKYVNQATDAAEGYLSYVGKSKLFLCHSTRSRESSRDDGQYP